MPKPKVILMRCDAYDSDKIKGLISQGMEAMDLRPTGRTIIKPNVVIAHEKYFPHSYTRPEFIEGVISAAKERSENLESLNIAERCGITIPTRMAFAEAGYKQVAKRQGVKLISLEEVPQVEVELKHPDRLRDYVYTPQPIAECNFMINCPKFKAHPWTTVTFALKNWIGIQDDRHRMIDHDFHLNQKIADLQEIVVPDFIAIDAIVGGQDRMLTAVPFDLGLVIMGNNPVAIDAVCCRILGIKPEDVDHIRFCYERGLGPIATEEIDISGDITLAEAAGVSKTFRHGLIRVEDYFEGTHITAHAGPPEKSGSCDYCWGGCPGAMEEAIEIVRTTDPNVDKTMKPLHVIFGHYEGEIKPGPKEKVLFMGDCAAWKGELNSKPLELTSRYKSSLHRDPRHASFSDLIVKMVIVLVTAFKRRKDDYIRVPGCPVSVAEQVLYISRVAKTKNPYFEPSIVVPFFLAYIFSKIAQLFNRLRGIPYQKMNSLKKRSKTDGKGELGS